MLGLGLMGIAAILCIVVAWRCRGTWRLTRVGLVLWSAAIVAGLAGWLPRGDALWVGGIVFLLMVVNAIVVLGGPPDPHTRTP